VLVLGERVSGRLWVGFGIVWVALVLLGVDSLRTANASRTERRRVADDTTGTARLGSDPDTSRVRRHRDQVTTIGTSRTLSGFLVIQSSHVTVAL
jgi:hypothetical protein